MGFKGRSALVVRLSISISPASLPTDLPAIAQLFRAYAASLPIDLGYQGFDGELASLRGTHSSFRGIAQR